MLTACSKPVDNLGQAVRTQLVDGLLARLATRCEIFTPNNSSTFLLQIYRTIFDEARVISLKTNGEDIAVTNENRAEFVHLYVDYLLNRSIAPQFDALSRGFHKVTHLCLQFFTRTKRYVQLIDNSHA